LKVVRIILLLVLLGAAGATIFIVYFKREESPSVEKVIKRVKIELPPKTEPEPGKPPEVTAPPTLVTKPEVPAVGKGEAMPPSRPEPGSVVKESVSKPEAPPEEKAIGSWVVHIASFTSKEEAQSMVERLKGGGHNAYLTESNIKGKRWYRVRVGFYQTEDETRTIGREISTKYHIRDMRIVKLGKKDLWKGL